MKIRSRFLTKLLAAIAVGLLRLLFRTCRVQVILTEPGTCAYQATGERRFLYSVWHDQLLMTIFSGRPKQMAGLVSSHQDGSYLADAMKLVGIRPVRGSTKRGGDRALRELLDAVKDWHVAITPDGPRGPRHEVKPGIIYLASRTGRAIYPAAHLGKNCWRIPGSWTDMMLPKPFSKVLVLIGSPLHVPPSVGRDEMAHYAGLLKQEMDRLQQEADRIIYNRPAPSVPVSKAA